MTAAGVERRPRWTSVFRIGVAGFIAVALSLASRATASTGIDQRNAVGSSYCGATGQTFSPVRTNMTGFDLTFAGSGTWAYKIVNWSTRQDVPGATGGTPSSPLSVSGPTHFDLPSAISIQAGQKYAIVRTGGSITYFLCNSGDDPYPNGSLLSQVISGGQPAGIAESPSDDAVFTTYYDTALNPATCGGSGDGSTQNTCAYSYTGAADTFTVPAGVRSIHVDAVGGHGGAAGMIAGVDHTPGGYGAHVTADVPVRAGRTLYVLVGGNGGDLQCTQCSAAGGFNGGANSNNGGAFGAAAGGGASDVRSSAPDVANSLDTRLVVAGGGGGAGGEDANFGFGGPGGDADAAGTDGTYAGGGGAGSSTAGGAGGTAGPAGAAGAAGSQGVGGAGGYSNGNGGPGGGGGGGWYGGGGGGGGGGGDGAFGGGGGGGGGSSYPATALIDTDTSATPSVTITWVVVADPDPPAVTVSFTPDGDSGWFKTSPATGTVTADDTDTGGSTITDISCSGATVGTVTGLDTVTASAPITVSDEGITTVTCTATDSSANTSVADSGSTASVQLDSTKPLISSSAATSDTLVDYTAGTWTNHSITVVFACADVGDAQSGVVTDTVAGSTLASDTSNGSVSNTGTCVDEAGNTADAATFSPIKIDKTAPVITATATKTGGSSYTAGTWTNLNVTVTFACADTGTVPSGLASNTVAGGGTQSSETSTGSMSSTGACTDTAGNTAATPVTFSPIKIDKTAPVITVASVSSIADGLQAAETFTSATSTFPVNVGSQTVSESGTSSDGGSGVATVSVNGSPATGTTSWSASGTALAVDGATAVVNATDQAGNVGVATAATYRMDLDADGIANNVDGDTTVSPPVSQSRVASTRFSDKLLSGGATSGQVRSLASTATILITDAPVGLSVQVAGSGCAKFAIDGKTGLPQICAVGSGILGDPPGIIQMTMVVGAGTITYDINGQQVVVDVDSGSTATVTETYSNGTLTGLTVQAVDSTTGGPTDGVTINGTPAGTATLAAKLDLSSARFDLYSTLTLGSGGPLALPAPVVLGVGSYSASIPSSQFKKTKKGYSFSATVHGVALNGQLTKPSPTQYQLNVTGLGPNGAASGNPVVVSVGIGPSTGVTLVNADPAPAKTALAIASAVGLFTGEGTGRTAQALALVMLAISSAALALSRRWLPPPAQPLIPEA